METLLTFLGHFFSHSTGSSCACAIWRHLWNICVVLQSTDLVAFIQSVGDWNQDLSWAFRGLQTIFWAANQLLFITSQVSEAKTEEQNPKKPFQLCFWSLNPPKLKNSRFWSECIIQATFKLRGILALLVRQDVEQSKLCESIPLQAKQLAASFPCCPTLPNPTSLLALFSCGSALQRFPQAQVPSKLFQVPTSGTTVDRIRYGAAPLSFRLKWDLLPH